MDNIIETRMSSSPPFLHIIMGPMFSGKSTELIRLIREFKFIEKNILVIKHCSDDCRYAESMICTHDQQKENCLSLGELETIENSKVYQEAEIVFIEEAQFFNGLSEFIKKGMEEKKKSFIIAGLDGDFKREPFGEILSLIPYSNKVTKLNALCKFCKNGTEAPFTKRLSKSTKQHLVGGEEEYASVCRYHYDC